MIIKFKKHCLEIAFEYKYRINSARNKNGPIGNLHFIENRAFYSRVQLLFQVADNLFSFQYKTNVYKCYMHCR